MWGWGLRFRGGGFSIFIIVGGREGMEGMKGGLLMDIEEEGKQGGC